MTEVFKKLNFKGQSPILIPAHPASFEPEFAAIRGETEVHEGAAAGASYRFALAFALTKAELLRAASALIAATQDDAIIWLAYPKLTSPKYRGVSDLDRDVCWKTLEPLGLQPNRQIAIDEDWSALRYKKVR